MIGKVPPAVLEQLVLGRTGVSDERVRCGPAYGEDSAAIDLGAETLVVSSDPISLAVERIGTLGVSVACNDVAAAGADPAWLTSVLFLPEEDEETLAEITRQLDEGARTLGVSIVGGHSEYAPALETPLLVLTCLGVTDRFIPTSGANPGEKVVLTGGSGIEGTAILASDFCTDLEGNVPEEVFDRALNLYDEIAVVEEAAILREWATAMHDPTEGGILAGMFELAAASEVTLQIDSSAIPVREETRVLCAAAGVDPLRIFGSGGLLATVAAESVDAALTALDEQGVTAAVIGEVTSPADATVVVDNEPYRTPIRDDMYDLWE